MANHKELLEQKLKDMGATGFHVTFDDEHIRKLVDEHGIEHTADSVYKEIFESIERIERGEAELISFDDSVKEKSC